MPVKVAAHVVVFLLVLAACRGLDEAAATYTGQDLMLLDR